jgi:hypothetical protein
MERLKTVSLAIIAANLTFIVLFMLGTAATAQMGDSSTLYCSGMTPFDRWCAVRVVVVSAPHSPPAPGR